MVFKKKSKSRARRFFSRKARSRSSGSGLSVVEVGVGSAAYGVARPYAANMIPDVPQLGAYSDNIVLGAIGALAAWKGKGMIKKAGMIVLANEAFVAGSKVSFGVTPQSQDDSVQSN